MTIEQRARANDTGLSGFTRRSLLAAAPASLAYVALPGAAVAAAGVPSPVFWQLRPLLWPTSPFLVQL